MRAVLFLQKYRVLEGLLEKRYADRKNLNASPVIEYMHDPDSEPVRTDLNLLREIRNILSHNSDSDGDPVIEPSEEMLDRLTAILAYVTRMRRADQYGTEASRILCALPEDRLLTVMRKMHEQGFSHAPVLKDRAVIGILSRRCLFDFVAENGLDAINAGTLVSDLSEYTALNSTSGDRYLFVPADTDISTVRRNFNRRGERNRRLALVLVTQHGSTKEPLLRLITPWDAISDDYSSKGGAVHD